MNRTRLWNILFVSFVASATAQASLGPVVQETGRLRVSADAVGTNASGPAFLRVDKPVATATVRRAFLMAASHDLTANNVILDGDVMLGGVPVSWERGVFSNASVSINFFHNVFAEVTSIVRPRLNGRPGGITTIPVTELGTDRINGTLLVVIFDDPSQTHDSTAILLFGAQDVAGDTFDIALAEPVPADGFTETLFGLGISHSFQGAFGTDMINRVVINGQRLTSSAGGEDDGTGENGGLITVGGVGDSPANPPPFADPSDLAFDDELYDVKGFLAPGDDSIDVFSFNPTGDDNIFFAYLVTPVPAAVTPDVDPPGDRDLIGNLNPNRPTIVLTHGLQPEDMDDVDELWSGFEATQAGGLIVADLAIDNRLANVVQYVWSEGFAGRSRDGYLAAREKVADAGVRLASELVRGLGPGYSRPIHFVGHSLGTIVNAYAAAAFLDATPVTQAQFTSLDRPDNISNFPLISEDDDRFGFGPDFFANVLPMARPSLLLRVDNYFSRSGTGVGDVATGAVYNHPPLVEPNDLEFDIFNDPGTSTNHSGVQQWYRWTVSPLDPPPIGPTVCDQTPPNLPFGFDDSLNPCDRGWDWSLIGGQTPFPANNGVPAAATTDEPVFLTQSQEFGCTFSGTPPATVITCDEASSPFAVAEINLPEGATTLSFEYRFANRGDGDFASVLIDDEPIWVVSGQSALDSAFQSSGPISLNGLTGQRRLTVTLHGVDQANARFALRNIKTDAANPAVFLNDDRFRVELAWRTANGNTGVARPVPTDANDSGLLWFFNPDNWEMLIKVLDNCDGPTNRFWVFAAATTNVEYTLRVIDLQTGQVREYFNPLGTASAAITDTNAFATCNANAALVEGPSKRVVDLSQPDEHVQVEPWVDPVDAVERGNPEALIPKAERETAFDRGVDCSVTPRRMCLADGRFAVEVDWLIPSGLQGEGSVVPLGSNSSGLFWFFNPDNWEMLVKVLDNCDGPTNRFWVFAAATTNVGYTLRVIDTLTGAVRTYDNPLGVSSPAITDTGAFDTCSSTVVSLP